MVTNLLQAPLLVLLTNVDGLYAGDPRSRPGRRGSCRPCRTSTARSRTWPAATKSTLGTGGMRSKLRAARLATAAGESVIMANGSTDGILDAIFAGEPVGTLFLPHGEALSARSAGSGSPPGRRGLIRRRRRPTARSSKGPEPAADRRDRRSTGSSARGTWWRLCDADGVEFARGLTNYSAADAQRIRGLATEQIGRALGKVPYVEIVHRDNLHVVC